MHAECVHQKVVQFSWVRIFWIGSGSVMKVVSRLAQRTISTSMLATIHQPLRPYPSMPSKNNCKTFCQFERNEGNARALGSRSPADGGEVTAGRGEMAAESASCGSA
jgi:hypothetical protein